MYVHRKSDDTDANSISFFKIYFPSLQELAKIWRNSEMFSEDNFIDVYKNLQDHNKLRTLTPPQ